MTDNFAYVEQLRIVMHGSNVRRICKDVDVLPKDVKSEDRAGTFVEDSKYMSVIGH